MLGIFDGLRALTPWAVALKIGLALLCGGTIGLEREIRQHSAGLRTHILICLGAAMATLTSQYLVVVQGYTADITRMGAQVIAGVGLIVAGTILVTRENRVKGLTTAAGIWATAVVGLCLGAGFYEGALVTTALILFAEVFLMKLERKLLTGSTRVRLYVHYQGETALDRSLDYFRSRGIVISGFEMTRDGQEASVMLTVKLPRALGKQRQTVLEGLQALEGVSSAQIVS